MFTKDVFKSPELKFITRTKIFFNTFDRKDAIAYHRNKYEVRWRSQFDITACIIQAFTIPVMCPDIAGTKPDTSVMLELKQQQQKQLPGEVMFLRTEEEPGIRLLIGSDNLQDL